jgi:hypothetical protein
MCDTCEANEITIKILTKRIYMIEELLMHMTNSKSADFLNVFNDLNKAHEHNMSSSVVKQLQNDKNRVIEEIKSNKTYLIVS